MTVARSPAVASRSARVRRRAAAASSWWGPRVPVTARGRVRRPKTSRAARSALPRTAFSCSRLSAASGGKGGGGGAKSEATASASISMARARALASSEGILMTRGAGGAASGSRPRIRHQRRARVVRVRRSSSAVAWNSRQVARRRSRFSVPMAVSTLAATGAVSSGSRMPASSRASRRAAAAPASRGLAGSAPAAVKSARTSLVAQARSQRRSAGRRPAWRASMRDSSSWRAAWHQFARSSGGMRTWVWAAWAHSWTRAPQVTG